MNEENRQQGQGSWRTVGIEAVLECVQRLVEDATLLDQLVVGKLVQRPPGARRLRSHAVELPHDLVLPGLATPARNDSSAA